MPGQIADAAGRDLGVLFGDGSVDVGRGEVEADQLLRVEPDSHGTLRPVQLCLADALGTTDFVHHMARQVIAQADVVEATVIGAEGHQHQEARRHLFHLQALLGHGLGQARLHHLEAVLHIDLGQLGVGARFEGGGDRCTAQAALGLEVQQVVGAV
ncbi:hypothetical protein D9M71_539010 [compost metagenome]